ncbi:MAG: indolepyruvate oxidoreductase subunit beta family protein [Rhodobacteraceae bacterium]|nr:indolepyruvate oxidoreductase subunit beta family protein [Paracoccaceae bacterium]
MIETNISVQNALPVTLLIGALGGQGGGVLADWILTAAENADLHAQGTSVPGVAQRTGATTYYIEVFPVPRASLGGAQPILALYPCPGEVNVVITTELLEAGRAVEQGYVSGDKTILITSSHRDYSISEKVQPGRDFYDSNALKNAINSTAHSVFLGDFLALAHTSGSVLNAVLLGVLSESKLLPIDEEDFRVAISANGIAVERNLAGFTAGIDFVRNGLANAPAVTEEGRPHPYLAAGLQAQAEAIGLPASLTPLFAAAMERLREYQDQAYADEYASLIAKVLAADKNSDGKHTDLALSGAMITRLARVMCYNDIIQVARVKCGDKRHAHIHDEVGCDPSALLQVTEFLKPRREEIMALMPPGVARLFSGRPGAARSGQKLLIGTHTILGFGMLRFLAGLRFWRRRTSRFAQEADLRARWCSAVITLAGKDYQTAQEVAECSDLVRGYGETESRGRAKFVSILQDIVEPKLSGAENDAMGALRLMVQQVRDAGCPEKGTANA